VGTRVFLPDEIVPLTGRYLVVDVLGEDLKREISCGRDERSPFLERDVEFGYVLRATIYDLYVLSAPM
jgi:hypothetical protein